MKLFYPFALTFAAALSRASADDAARLLHRGGGGGMHGGFLGMDTSEEFCQGVCASVDADELDCDGITLPDAPDSSEATDGAGAREAWADYRAQMGEARRTIRRCACCTEATLEELVEGMCQDVDADALGCDDIAWPDPPETDDMDGAKKREAWVDFKSARADVRQRIHRCAMCTDATLEDLVPEGDRGWGKGKHGGKGRGKHGGAWGMDAEGERCEGVCEDVDGDDLTCDDIARPTRPNTSDMDDEEKEEACSNFMAAKKDMRQQVRRCVCCTDAAMEDIVPRPDRERGFGGKDRDERGGGCWDKGGGHGLGGGGWGKGKGGWGKGKGGWGKGKGGWGKGGWGKGMGEGKDGMSGATEPLGADVANLAKSSLLATASDPATEEIRSSAGRGVVSLAYVATGALFFML